MRKSFKRLSVALVAATAATGVTAGIGLVSSASAAQADPTITGSVTVTPSSGNSDTTFALGFSSAQTCPGDASSNYSVQTYITPRAEDPAAMVFAFAAPSGSAFTSYLRYTNGSQAKNINPGLATFDVPTANLTNLAFKNAAFSTLTAGEYWIGVSCALNDGSTTEAAKFWKTPLSITADNSTGGTNNFAYKVGFVPNAPTLGSRTTGDGQVSVAFTGGASIDGNPSTTGFTVVVKDATCSSAVTTETGASSPIVVTGLTNGTTYCFAVKETNSVGDSALSSTGTSTPNPAARGAVTSLGATPGVGKVTLNWVAPSPTPTAYSITVSPNTGDSTFVAGPYTGVTGVSKEITGLTGGTLYTFTITPSGYSDSPAGGGSFTGTAAQVQATPNSNQVIGQDNQSERPVGALLITVRCGKYGALDAFTKTTGTIPGFPKTLTSETATGTASYSGPSDPSCPLNMGTAELVRLDDDAVLGGNYYTASGRLSQVSIIDTRDTDSGWSVTATAGTFTGSLGDTFSGNYLGWVPKTTATSASVPTDSGTYDQTVTAGSQVLPGTGLASGDGLGDATPNTLASALAGAGLGEAQVDARLLLLIPVTADYQTYTGNLTLSLI